MGVCGLDSVEGVRQGLRELRASVPLCEGATLVWWILWRV